MGSDVALDQSQISELLVEAREMHGDLFKDTYLYSGHWCAGLRVWLASLDIPAGFTVLSASSGFSVSVWSLWEGCYGDRGALQEEDGGERAVGKVRSVGIIFLARDCEVTSSESSMGQWLGCRPW